MFVQCTLGVVPRALILFSALLGGQPAARHSRFCAQKRQKTRGELRCRLAGRCGVGGGDGGCRWRQGTWIHEWSSSSRVCGTGSRSTAGRGPRDLAAASNLLCGCSCRPYVAGPACRRRPPSPSTSWQVLSFPPEMDRRRPDGGGWQPGAQGDAAARRGTPRQDFWACSSGGGKDPEGWQQQRGSRRAA